MAGYIGTRAAATITTSVGLTNVNGDLVNMFWQDVAHSSLAAFTWTADAEL